MNSLDLVRNIASAMYMDPRKLRRIVCQWIRVYSEVVPKMRVNHINYNVNNQNIMQNLMEDTF